MARVIGICSQKGGVAKSTSTIEIASILKQMGNRVLVIDLDQQCSLTKDIGAVQNGITIYNALHGECPINDAIQHLEIFDCIAGSASLSRADREFIDDDDNFLLADLCDIIKDDYDYILIDNSPSRNKLLTMTYVVTDYVIIPTECDESSKDSLVTTQNDIYKLVNSRHHDSHALVIGYILTKYEKTIMHQVAIDDLKELAKKNPAKPFVLTVRKSIKASEVKTFHTSMAEMYRSLPVSMDYQLIVEEMIKTINKLERKRR